MVTKPYLIFITPKKVVTGVLTACFAIVSFVACNTAPAPQTPLQQGEVLAKQYCKSCHQYPEPGLLDKTTWQMHVLPAMAPRLGIKVYDDDMYINNANAKSTVTFDEWIKIVEFYKALAPATLKPVANVAKPAKTWAQFSLKKPTAGTAEAMTTMVAFNKFNKKLYTGNAQNNTLNEWSDKLLLKNKVVFASPAVDAKFYVDDKQHQKGAFTFIGSLDAYDRLTGSLADIDLQNISNENASRNIANGLNRGVQSVSADFNKDGLVDWAVCEFGHNLGGLSLFTKKADGSYVKTAVRPVTGATNIITGDYNNDGWPDLMCLFAQADEGIWLFLNDHKGGFISRNILRFPPVYGSTSFQLVDMNGDGQLDILYTCGDNSDYSRVLKPYHGVYIFTNQGGYNFKQSFFYPINGATKAMAADLNADGKQDIAVIAFFSDLKNNPAEGFTYLEQTKPMQFTANNIPIDAEGRWISMDVADYNNDGKPDVILGNFSVGFINQVDVTKNWNLKTPFIVLQNNSK